MKNKEFYKDQLEELLIVGQSHAICMFRREHINECDNYCEDNGIGGCATCHEAFKNWLNVEHKEKIKLTLFEKLLLEKVLKHQKGFNYIARDEGGSLYLYQTKPYKEIGCWTLGTSSCPMYLFKDLFQFITWADEEPIHISTLLNNCEVVYEDCPF